MLLVKKSAFITSRPSRKTSMVFAKASKDNDGYRRNLVGKLLKMAVEKAKRVCEQSTDKHACAVAWDLAEDYETTLRRMKQVLDDPMESYCLKNPADLECRIYDV